MDCAVFLRTYTSAALNREASCKDSFPEIQTYPFTIAIHIYAAE